MSLFGNPVTEIDHLGSYSCRNVEGRQRGSEHALPMQLTFPPLHSRTAGRYLSFATGNATAPSRRFCVACTEERATTFASPSVLHTTRLTPITFTSIVAVLDLQIGLLPWRLCFLGREYHLKLAPERELTHLLPNVRLGR
jgi:Extensin-like protein C-terminus